jgi:hypothetical protein
MPCVKDDDDDDDNNNNNNNNKFYLDVFNGSLMLLVYFDQLLE